MEGLAQQCLRPGAQFGGAAAVLGVLVVAGVVAGAGPAVGVGGGVRVGAVAPLVGARALGAVGVETLANLSVQAGGRLRPRLRTWAAVTLTRTLSWPGLTNLSATVQ